MDRPASDPQPLPPNAQRFAHNAMATVFEIVIVHNDAGYAEQCAHEAFREVDRLEQALSRFIENSDVSRINVAPVDEAVRVGIDAFECLEHCTRLHAETNGACDVTIGALLDYWSQAEASGGRPEDDRLAELRERTGMQQIILNSQDHTVSRRSEHVRIDLGGYGKGYAIDRMAAVLGDWDIGPALLHGGASSVLALDAPPERRGWPLTVRDPAATDHIVGRLSLRNLAMSGSGLRKGRHIIDPRTALPATANRAAWSITETAATGDALSTAFMIMSGDEIRAHCEDHVTSRAILIPADAPPGKHPLRIGNFDDLE